MQQILIITGMHRSGTSVITAAFESAGLDVGSRLMPAARGNPRGHFEDLDFVSLHERMLRANGLGPEGFTVADAIPVPPPLASEARMLIDERRTSSSIWGWKDPRTTLFLDWWAELLPDAKFLFLFRSPAEAIDSLFRRGDETFAMNPGFALDVWAAYNRRLLAFHRDRPDRCFLVDAASAVAGPERLVSQVRERWNLPLAEPDPVTAEGLFRRVVSQDRRAIVAAVQPSAWELFASLREAAGHTEREPIDSRQPLSAVALTEWSRASGLEARVAQAEAQAREASALLDGLMQERDAARAELLQRSREPVACAEEIGLIAGSKRSGGLPVHRKIVRETRRLFRRWGRGPSESLGRYSPHVKTASASWHGSITRG